MYPVRWKSVFYDHQYITLAVLFLFTCAVMAFFRNESVNVGLLLPGIVVWVVITKDMLDGRSWGKRQVGLQVVDHNHPNRIASLWQCIFRNLTILILPIEMIFMLAGNQRRLGDFLAGTTVVDYIPERSGGYTRLNLMLGFLCSFGLSVLVTVPFWGLDQLINQHMRHYDHEYNPALSTAVFDRCSLEIKEARVEAAKVYDRSARGQNLLILLKFQTDHIQYTHQNKIIGDKVKRICDELTGDSTYRCQCKIEYNCGNHQRSIDFPVR